MENKSLLKPLFFLALFLAPSLFAAEPPIDVTFYYSQKDPHLANAEKALAEAVKQMPQLRINRVAIDTPEGYKQLAEEEKRLDIKDPGEMTMVFGPIYLTSKGEKRYIEQCFAGAMKRLIGQMKGDNSFKGRTPVNIEGYAKEVFGADIKLESPPNTKDDPIVYYKVTRGGQLLGWAVDAYHAIGCPICSDAQFVLAADAKGTITDLRPARELERWGATLPLKETAVFVAQFKRKSPDNAPLKIDGISGATKTSYAYQTAINEILAELKKQSGK